MKEKIVNRKRRIEEEKVKKKVEKEGRKEETKCVNKDVKYYVEQNYFL